MTVAFKKYNLLVLFGFFLMYNLPPIQAQLISSKLSFDTTLYRSYGKLTSITYETFPIHRKPIQLILNRDVTLTHGQSFKFEMLDSNASEPKTLHIVVGYTNAMDFYIAADANFNGHFETPEFVLLAAKQPDFAALRQKIDSMAFLPFVLSGFNNEIQPFTVLMKPRVKLISDKNQNGMLSDSMYLNLELLGWRKYLQVVRDGEDSFLLSLNLSPLMGRLADYHLYAEKLKQGATFTISQYNHGMPGNLIGYGSLSDFIDKRKTIKSPPIQRDWQLDELDLNTGIMLLSKKALLLDSLTAKQVSTLMQARPQKRYVEKGSGIIPVKDTTLLFFSASWCVPCRAITKEVLAASKKYHLNLVVVLNEHNYEAGIKYAATYPKGISLFYDPPAHETNLTIKNIFNIGLFPSFVLIGPSYEVIAYGGAEVMERFMK